MPNWNDADVIRVAARLTTASLGDVMNVFHYKLDLVSPIGDTTAMGYMATAIDDMYDFIEPGIPSDVTFRDIDFTNLTQRLVYSAQPWPVQNTGGGTGDTMPEQVCGLVVARTNAPKVVGRKFLGPFIESANSDGAWYNTLLTQMASFAADYITNVVLGTNMSAKPGVARVVNDVVTAFNYFVEAYVTTQIYTQRRRRRGFGS